MMGTLWCFLRGHRSLRFGFVVGSLAEVRCDACGGHWLTKDGEPVLVPWNDEIEIWVQRTLAQRYSGG